MEDFKLLFEKGEQIACEHPSAKQVIVVKTTKDHVYYFLNTEPLEPVDEDRFLNLIREKEDVQIRKMVCMWNGSDVDLPHIRFRQRLVELCPENGDAYILLQGEGHYVAQKLSVTMPCK